MKRYLRQQVLVRLRFTPNWVVFMLAPHGALVTRVTHKKETYRTYLGVDASAVNLMRPAMYGAYHHITNLTHPEGPAEVVDVVGSLCETMINLQ